MKSHKKQKGSVVIFCLIILVFIVGIAITIFSFFIPKLKASSDAINSIVAIYAADSGMEWCLYINRDNPSPPSQPTLPSGVTLNIYNSSSGSSSDCTESSINHRSVATFRNISRSFEVNEP